MIIYREIGSSYHHKPIAQGVDYSPLIMEIDEEVLVKERRCRPVMMKREAPCPRRGGGGGAGGLGGRQPLAPFFFLEMVMV